MVGLTHGSDFGFFDEELSFISSTKLLAMSLIDLLATGAGEALRVKRQYRPTFANREEYLRMWQDLCQNG